MTLSAGTRFGTYEIVSLLGAGGMGQVYRARDTTLNRDVAIKVLPEVFAADPDRVARFTREAQVLAALNHSGIAQIHGLTSNALVMELVEGEDLSVVISRGAIALPDALAIARQMAEALEAAHDAGFIHRDLKPANIKIRPDGIVKILDFGLAKALAADGTQSVDTMNSPTLTARATQMGTVLGTAAYMAPEQARGRPVDRRADIWAFGAVLYEMFTGQRAFEGDDVSITLANVLKEDVRWDALPPALPASVHRLLRRCLEKDPKRRLSAIGDARLELDDTTAAAAPTTSSRQTSMVPWIVAAIATVAAAWFGWLAFGGPVAPAAATWTSIPAPIDTFSRGLGPAVSPDGRLVAFVAPDTSGQDVLWVRAFTAQSSQPLIGTEGAASPFWSSDGSTIGFFRNQQLQTIPAAGGSTRVIAATTTNPRGGTWGQDGTILFVPAPGLAIHRVSGTAGGDATPLTSFASPDDALAQYPSFLPDGNHFLFTSVGDDGSWINVGSLADGSTTKLLQAYSRAEYAAGYLLFGSKGGLYAQQFDPATRTLTGERARIVESIGVGAGHTINYSFSSSADGAVLVAGTNPFLPLSQLTWFDRTGQRLETLGEPAHLFGFSASPDRTRVVLEKLDPRANSIDPWVTVRDSGFTTPLRAASEGALASIPTWSHDSKRVFYSSGYGLLKSVAATGGTEDAWTVGSHWTLTSAPDGSVILISQQGGATGNDITAVSLTGDHTPKPYLRTPFNENSARFSPNGASVAYVSNETGRNEVYIESFPQTGNKVRVSSDGGIHPEWSEDGRELYFARDEPDGTRSLWSAQVTGGRIAPQRLFGAIDGFWQSNRGSYAVFDQGRRLLLNVLVPPTAPQVLTVGQNWSAALGKR
jgi:Tol biopolymer transport system component